MLRIAGRALLPSYSPCLALQLLPVGMLAFDGRCMTLDSAADGYVRGEACIVFLLGVEISQAGSGVVIAGSAVNQDGRSSSLTAPNGPSQQQVGRLAPHCRAVRWSSQSLVASWLRGRSHPSLYA